jgi:hypothetical protein
VLLTFDAPVDPERIDLGLGGLAVDRLYGAPTDPTKVYALTATQTPGATYTATVVYAGVSVPNPDEPLRGSDRPDRRPPELTDAAPNGVTLQADSLSLSFSEPMDTSRVPQAEDWAPPDSSRSWTGHWRWAGPLRLVYDLSTSPPPGEHRFDVGLGRMQDLAGNAATDSAGTFDFELLPAAEAGAIAGVALWPSETAPIRLQLVGGTRQLRETVADASGAFEFAPIVPGDYVLVAFVDRDGNGVHDRGRLDPFVPAEPMALVDTLSVERGQRQTVHLPVEPPE